MAHSRRGFSLPELLAVIAIMAILAAVSTPYIRDYLRDATNDKAKVALNIIAQGHKTFKADYPKATITSGIVSGVAAGNCKNVQRTGSNSVAIFLGCRYVQGISWASFPYDFYIGPCTAGCSAPSTALSCMKPKASAATGKYASYCAWVDQYGNVYDTL